MTWRNPLYIALLGVGLALGSACTPLQPVPGQGSNDTVQDESPLAAGSATQAVDFDPASIPIDETHPLVPGECGPSAIITASGAFRCTTEAGGMLDPCFVVKGEDLLACNPNPVFETWGAHIQSLNSLPVEASAAAEPTVFYLDIGPNNPPCEKRSPEPSLQIGGEPVSFNCQAPGAWITGPIDRRQAAWTVQYVITSSDGATVTSGPTATEVIRAWQY